VRLRLLPVLLASVAGATLLLAVAGGQRAFGAHQGKKRCHFVTRKVHGKTKRVRVCTAPPKPKRPTPVPQADLMLAAVAPLDIVVGRALDYHVTVVNRGPQVARGVTLAIDSPIALTKVRPSLAPGQAASCDPVPAAPAAFRCHLDALAANDQWVLEFAGTAKRVGQLRFAAAVRSSTADPVDRNSAVEALTTVTPAHG
jgi:Domain of unknown function DUF11